MFVVTNRRIDTRKKDLDMFSDAPNEKGAHELRLFQAEKPAKDWQVKLVDNTLDRDTKKRLGLPVSRTAYGSQYVAAEILRRVRDGKRDLLVFIHGYNNDVEDVLERAALLEETYRVEVLAFSWPSNGGGVKGPLSYKSDKRDARASVGAVYRTLGKLRGYLDAFNAERLRDVRIRASDRFPHHEEQRQAYITLLAERDCPFSVSLLCHSMGNYLFKQLHTSSIYDDHHMLFDNVILAAADANNAGHAAWVDAIRCRKRVYITINEDDAALRLSRIKSGEEQRARLGHYLHGLNASQALYVDVTDTNGVGNSHAYFEGDPVEHKRSSLRRFFKGAFRGERAEGHLDYIAATGTWQPKA
jgi:esterase/lipase superfamily enzyme